jgi:prepilin-type N-terminal cleavage/methylation domain-containing protein
MQSQKGFTLIEVVITIAIFTILIFLVSAMLNDIFVNSNQELISMSNIDQARSVLSTFTNEIRNSVIGSDGSYPLAEAGNSEIIFFTNLGISNSTVNRIRYYISGSTLYKGIVQPSGNPLSYNLTNEKVITVAAGVATGSATLFSYYDGNYSGSGNPLAQPVNISQIRYIKMNLQVKNNITKNDASSFSVTAGAALRSLKDNLGN